MSKKRHIVRMSKVNFICQLHMFVIESYSLIYKYEFESIYNNKSVKLWNTVQL